jgi:serine phosphatase RsbU (regulator of sigma subunit)
MGSIDFPYNYEIVKIDSGDSIIFYTDGVPEAMNVNEEEFGEKRFEELLLSNRNLHPNDLSKVIFDEIKKYRGDAEQSDDITLGILRVK